MTTDWQINILTQSDHNFFKIGVPKLLDLFGKISKGKYTFRDKDNRDKGDTSLGEDKDFTEGAF